MSTNRRLADITTKDVRRGFVQALVTLFVVIPAFVLIVGMILINLVK